MDFHFGSEGIFFPSCSSLLYLKVFECLSPEQWIGRLQLEDSQHDEKHMDAERPSTAATGLMSKRQQV